VFEGIEVLPVTSFRSLVDALAGEGLSPFQPAAEVASSRIAAHEPPPLLLEPAVVAARADRLDLQARSFRGLHQTYRRSVLGLPSRTPTARSADAAVMTTASPLVFTMNGCRFETYCTFHFAAAANTKSSRSLTSDGRALFRAEKGQIFVKETGMPAMTHDASAPLQRALLSLDGLSVGDSFGERTSGIPETPFGACGSGSSRRRLGDTPMIPRWRCRSSRCSRPTDASTRTPSLLLSPGEWMRGAAMAHRPWASSPSFARGCRGGRSPIQPWAELALSATGRQCESPRWAPSLPTISRGPWSRRASRPR
jgi:hypothetical protein